jgi:hypothetical protein
MLLGEIPVVDLANVSLRIWKAPLDLKGMWYRLVDVVGCFEDYDLASVRIVGDRFWL